MVVAMIGFSWLDLRAFVCFCVVELNQSASLEVVALIKSALALASLYQQSALGKLSAKAEAEDAEAEGFKGCRAGSAKGVKRQQLIPIHSRSGSSTFHADGFEKQVELIQIRILWA